MPAKKNIHTWMMLSRCLLSTQMWVWEILSLTEDMKLEAVVVTVVQVEEDEYLSALARKVHITALQVNSSPPHSSLRGIWS